jgi:hypothetical protein
MLARGARGCDIPDLSDIGLALPQPAISVSALAWRRAAEAEALAETGGNSVIRKNMMQLIRLSTLCRPYSAGHVVSPPSSPPRGGRVQVEVKWVSMVLRTKALPVGLVAWPNPSGPRRHRPDVAHGLVAHLRAAGRPAAAAAGVTGQPGQSHHLRCHRPERPAVRQWARQARRVCLL